MLARCIGFAAEGGGESREVSGAVMIDVVGLQHRAREFREQIRFFVGGAVGADHADG